MTPSEKTSSQLLRYCECVSAKSKATEQYFPVVMSNTLYKIDFESGDAVIKFDYPCFAIRPCRAVYCAVQDGSNSLTLKNVTTVSCNVLRIFQFF